MSSIAYQRAQLEGQLAQLLTEADTLAAGNVTKEVRSKIDVKLAQAANLRGQLAGLVDDSARFERLAEVARELGMPVPVRETATEAQRTASEATAEFREYLATGKAFRTYAGMSVATDNNGGYFVPQDFYSQVTAALKQTDGLWDKDVITMVESDHGNSMTFPLIDDTAAAAVQVSENANGSETEIATIDRLQLGKVPTWRSGKIYTTIELLQDSGVDVQKDIVTPAVSKRFQRGVSSANVATLISAATSGAISASASQVTLGDCLNLMASVDPAYLESQKCFWGMNFSTLVSLLRQVDTAGRYQWKPRTDANGRLLLFEKPIVLMPALANVGANNKPVFLGDFSKAVRRTVNNSLTILRYEQSASLAENGVVAFQAFLRTSFGVLASSSSDSPIKYLTCAAS
jgi:HK97 family phage major capsid protein